MFVSDFTNSTVSLKSKSIILSNPMAWTEIIEPKRRMFDLRLKEAWHYRDLLVMWVKRDFTATYKQTILGPIWIFLQPLLMTAMFILVFGRFAQISTDGLPRILFYLSGITIWNYFSESFTKTANVFKDNANIFGKVYFPRIVMPLSIVSSNLVRFVIQFGLFLAMLLYFVWKGNTAVHPNIMIALTPLLLIIMAGFALGAGMLISSMTTKYRDLAFLLTFGVQLLMYATPVIYPVSALPEKYRVWVMANPIAPVVETFRYAFLGSGSFSWTALGYSTGMMLLMLSIGVVVFNRVEKNFMDTV
jgi:lipopolysaccharide transport system permease protein